MASYPASRGTASTVHGASNPFRLHLRILCEAHFCVYCLKAKNFGGLVGHLGISGGLLEASGIQLGSHPKPTDCERVGARTTVFDEFASRGHLAETFWSPLVASGAVFGQYWGHLGAIPEPTWDLLGSLGSILAPLGESGGRFGGSMGHLRVSWSRLQPDLSPVSRTSVVFFEGSWPWERGSLVLFFEGSWPGSRCDCQSLEAAPQLRL